MPVLKALSLTALPKSLTDPMSVRRSKLVARLEEQQKLLTDPNHVRTVQRWTGKGEAKTLTTKQQRVQPWWRTDATGHTFMCVKYGNKPVEFEKGKAAIAVRSKDDLPKVIDTLIAAVRAGELDDVIAQTSKKQPGTKGRRTG